MEGEDGEEEANEESHSDDHCGVGKVALRLGTANPANLLWHPEADLVSSNSNVDLAPSRKSIGARLPMLGHLNIVLVTRMRAQAEDLFFFPWPSNGKPRPALSRSCSLAVSSV